VSDRPSQQDVPAHATPSAGDDARAAAADSAPRPRVLGQRAVRSARLALLLLLVVGAVALAAPSQSRWHPLLAHVATVLIVSVAIARAEDRVDRTAVRTVVGLAWIALVLTGLFGLKTPAVLAAAATLYGWSCLVRAGRDADCTADKPGRGVRTAALLWLLLATGGCVLVWRALLQ